MLKLICVNDFSWQHVYVEVSVWACVVRLHLLNKRQYCNVRVTAVDQLCAVELGTIGYMTNRARQPPMLMSYTNVVVE